LTFYSEAVMLLRDEVAILQPT